MPTVKQQAMDCLDDLQELSGKSVYTDGEVEKREELLTELESYLEDLYPMPNQ